VYAMSRSLYRMVEVTKMCLPSHSGMARISKHLSLSRNVMARQILKTIASAENTDTPDGVDPGTGL
jgi:hypothetical protein